MRDTDPRASRPHAPVHPVRRRVPLRTGGVTTLEIALHPTGSVLQAGNSLELALMAPAMAPEPVGQWGFMPLPMSIQTLHVSPAHPSRILLPVAELHGK